MSLITMLFGLNAPVKTPEQRAVLMFLAEFSNTDEQALCDVDELCQRIPISRERLEVVLGELCEDKIIRIRQPVTGAKIIRVFFVHGDA